MLRREDLHKYQEFCVKFLLNHPEALLILEMGLGKTIITLTAILILMYDRFEIDKCLVVSPLRVTKVWCDEAAAVEDNGNGAGEKSSFAEESGYLCD